MIPGRLLGSRRIAWIGGQGPRLRWRKNEGGRKRSIEEAVAIARTNGVEIPEDVTFFEAEPGELKGEWKGFRSGQRFETARGPLVAEERDGRVYWQSHYNREGKIPFRIHPDVLVSDEAIIAVFRHEMYELSLFRKVFLQSKTRSMDGTDYGLQVSEGHPGNFHDRAWDEADRILARVRRQKR